MNFKTKARVILASVAVFAIIGGTMAANAKRANTKIYFQAVDGKCTITSTFFTLVRPGSAPVAGNEIVTDVFDGACDAAHNYYATL